MKKREVNKRSEKRDIKTVPATQTNRDLQLTTEELALVTGGNDGERRYTPG